MKSPDRLRNYFEVADKQGLYTCGALLWTSSYLGPSLCKLCRPRMLRSNFGFALSPGDGRQPRERKQRTAGCGCRAEHNKDSKAFCRREIREQEYAEPTADHEQRGSNRPPQMRARLCPWLPRAQVRMFTLGEHREINHGIHAHTQIQVRGR